MRLELKNLIRWSVLGIALVLIIFIISQIFGTIILGKDIEHVEYISVRVDAGDTLWDLSKDYIDDETDSVSDYVNKVIKLNHMTSDTIYPGQHIFFPIINNDREIGSNIKTEEE